MQKPFLTQGIHFNNTFLTLFPWLWSGNTETLSLTQGYTFINTFLILFLADWTGNAKTLSNSRVSIKNTFLVRFLESWPGHTKDHLYLKNSL